MPGDNTGCVVGPWCDMALHTIWQSHGGQAFIGFDIIGDEATAVVFQNLSAAAWRFDYEWKGQPQTYTLNPATPQTAIGIPPGQRKWVSVILPGGEAGYDTDLGEFTVAGVDV